MSSIFLNIKMGLYKLTRFELKNKGNESELTSLLGMLHLEKRKVLRKRIFLRRQVSRDPILPESRVGKILLR